MSFPSTDSGYDKLRRILIRNDSLEPLQVWHAKVKDRNHEVVLKIFDLDNRNADFLDVVQVILFKLASMSIEEYIVSYI